MDVSAGKLLVIILVIAFFIAFLVGGLYRVGEGISDYSASQNIQAMEQTKQVQLQNSADIQKQQDYLAYLATLAALENNATASPTANNTLLQDLTIAVWSAVILLAGLVLLDKRRSKQTWPYNQAPEKPTPNERV